MSKIVKLNAAPSRPKASPAADRDHIRAALIAASHMSSRRDREREEAARTATNRKILQWVIGLCAASILVWLHQTFGG